MASYSVCVDGFNIALNKGYGIATYARNLIDAIRDGGAPAHLLYGPDRDVPDNALMAEVNLFDTPLGATHFPGLRQIGRNWRIYRSTKGREAKPVTTEGQVITRHISQRAPAVAARWACHDLFHTANHAYAAFGRLTSLTFAKGSQAAPDIMHWTCPLPLRAPGRPNLYTLHDLVPLRLPFTTLDNKGRYLALCREICAKADGVVTVSEHSKRDIVSILGVEESRITVTYQAAKLPQTFLATDRDEHGRQIENAFGLTQGEYFVFFGAIEPKKNLGRLIEAYLTAGVRRPLIIVGGKGWLDEDEIRLLYPDLLRGAAGPDGSPAGDRIRRYEYLPFGLLLALARGARAVLAPFLYEGFGLPVLEAMQLGTPVLTSAAGALPEVAGDAAVLVDPYDVPAIRDGIRALDADSDLRRHLSVQGPVQAVKFSPAAYQQRLQALYQAFA